MEWEYSLPVSVRLRCLRNYRQGLFFHVNNNNNKVHKKSGQSIKLLETQDLQSFCFCWLSSICKIIALHKITAGIPSASLGGRRRGRREELTHHFLFLLTRSQSYGLMQLQRKLGILGLFFFFFNLFLCSAENLIQ